MRHNGKPAGSVAVLFDLDGTLIDSVADLAAAVNTVLAAHGTQPLDVAAVRGMVGNGVAKLVQRAFEARGRPLDAAGRAAATDAMMAAYRDGLTARTTLMAGTAAALAQLRARGAALAVVTNKPQDATEAILDHFGLSQAFGAVVGSRPGLASKPAPDMLFAALDAIGATADTAVMVGDSAVDAEAARAAGLPCVLVRGGYARQALETLGADAVVDDLSGLADAIAAVQKAPAAG
ncbi:HAD-IA family hydrolase [Nitratireductor alexandrii]|uniref:HAD-IA family hydrolase n=1 Tax=Nitratireductor alexandrii TaxID=2448161 RepID=UPI000FD87749|nr:HAD-IA family hydrolase [Nitratireductor alexandrii]